MSLVALSLINIYIYRERDRYMRVCIVCNNKKEKKRRKSIMYKGKIESMKSIA